MKLIFRLGTLLPVVLIAAAGNGPAQAGSDPRFQVAQAVGSEKMPGGVEARPSDLYGSPTRGLSTDEPAGMDAEAIGDVPAAAAPSPPPAAPSTTTSDTEKKSATEAPSETGQTEPK